jgi:glycosyltransferase involved in cell wall biosynthesis
MTKSPDRGSREPRVAYLITSSGMGGAEREVCHLAEEFRRRGWAVAVISMLPLEPPISDLTAAGVLTLSLGMRQGVPDPRGVLRLARFLRRWRPHVLHAHMVHANLLARLSRLVAPVPVLISTLHNENEGRRWRYVAYRLTDALTDVTTTVSRAAVAAATRRGAAPAGSIILVPNGLSTAPYRPDDSIRERTRSSLGVQHFTWLAVGRLVDAKGYPDMIAAFVLARRAHPSATLLISGTGPLEPDVRRLIGDARLEDAVRLLGMRSDVPALMQAADGFVMTSRWEGLPMVLLEAGASGLPIVATDVGGSRDAVVDGVSGYLTAVAVPAETARAMTRVMEMSMDERRAMGRASRDHVSSTFEIALVADTWERLYRKGGEPGGERAGPGGRIRRGTLPRERGGSAASGRVVPRPARRG